MRSTFITEDGMVFQSEDAATSWEQAKEFIDKLGGWPIGKLILAGFIEYQAGDENWPKRLPTKRGRKPRKKAAES